jgi:aminoglycoside N3'-acetyltransferase
VDDLRRLGVTEGDVVLVHTSMRKVGPVDGGAETLVRALDDALGARGTSIVIAYPDESDEPFDHLTSVTSPDVGVLPEVFRCMPGTRVNDHPDGRFAARGALAVELLDDLPWDDYYGPGSVLARVVERRGKVLRLGADLDTVTLLHYAEYLAPVADKRRVRRTHRIRVGHDVVERVVECLDDSNGIVDHPGEDYFAQLLRAYLATGRASTGTFGHATAELLEAVDLVDFAVDWMAENLTPRPASGDVHDASTAAAARSAPLPPADARPHGHDSRRASG